MEIAKLIEDKCLSTTEMLKNVKSLLDAKISPDVKNGSIPPIFAAIRKCEIVDKLVDITIIDYLLDAKADLTAKYNGDSIIHWASRYQGCRLLIGSDRILATLIRLVPEGVFYMTDNSAKSALLKLYETNLCLFDYFISTRASKCKIEMIRFALRDHLVFPPANMMRLLQRDYFGNSYLHYMACMTTPVIASCRFVNGIAVVQEAENKSNMTIQINIQRLVQAGLPIDEKNKSGDTPLMTAARCYNYTAIKAFLKAGANRTLGSPLSLLPEIALPKNVTECAQKVYIDKCRAALKEN